MLDLFSARAARARHLPRGDELQPPGVGQVELGMLKIGLAGLVVLLCVVALVRAGNEHGRRSPAKRVELGEQRVELLLPRALALLRAAQLSLT